MFKKTVRIFEQLNEVEKISRWVDLKEVSSVVVNPKDRIKTNITQGRLTARCLGGNQPSTGYPRVQKGGIQRHGS
jgi:hypothetical protein